MPFPLLNIVTELINPLPGNSSVNTVKHATRDEAVFTMSSAYTLCNPFLSNGSVNTFRVSGDVINNKDGVFRRIRAECLQEKQM
jgi:hypothetical protein